MSRSRFSSPIARTTLISTSIATALMSVLLGAIAAQAQQPTAPSADASSSIVVSPNMTSTPSSAQTAAVKIDPFDLQRARNLARQAAERFNGGLEVYRTDPSMHGPTFESPFQDNGNGTVTFTFTGGAPGYVVPSIESIVTVNTTNWNITVDYNGAIRQTTNIR